MDLYLGILLLSGATLGLWYVIRSTRDLYRGRPKVYRCACKKHEFTKPDEHYDDWDVYHGLNLCQPHREMIVGNKKPPLR